MHIRNYHMVRKHLHTIKVPGAPYLVYISNVLALVVDSYTVCMRVPTVLILETSFYSNL